MQSSRRNAMRKAFVVIALWAVNGMAFAEDGVDDPHFALPVVVGGESACGAQPIVVHRTRADTVMSVLRVPKGEHGKEFVEVSGKSRKKDTASCVIDVRFEKPLEESRTMGVDFTGVEHKTPGATASLTVTLGSQRHVFDYPKGRVLDASLGKVLKRFQMIDLPAGTKRVRISIAGKASRTAYGDSAAIGFEALDLCFISPEEQPEFCGAPGFPNPRVSP
jgi:hypothetical protein